MATKEKWVPPYELELHRDGAEDKVWEVGGDFPSLAQAESALITLLERVNNRGYNEARIRRYFGITPSQKGRAKAICYLTWRMKNGRITHQERGPIWS